MAIPGSIAPSLSLRRSTQSGNKAMSAAYVAVYSDSSTAPWMFVSGEIDLSTMQVGDSIDIRVRKTMASGGTAIVDDTKTYTDAQPAGHQSTHIGSIINVYGVEISMRQTAGVLRTLNCEFFDAKRLGL